MKLRTLIVSFFVTGSLCACSWFDKQSTRPHDPVVMGISYIGVTVTDLNRSQTVYTEAANLSVVERSRIENSESLRVLSQGEYNSAESVLLAGTNAQLRFMQFSDTPASDHHAVPVNGSGIAHVCYQANQNTSVYKTFLSNGATHIGSEEMVQISSRNPVYYAYATDPDGIVIEIEEVDVSKLQLDSLPEHDFRIRQVALSTPDMDRALRFYSMLLEEQNPRRLGRWLHLSGEKVDAISGLPESEIEMAWFQTRNLELEIIQYHSHPPVDNAGERPIQATGYNMIMFEVSSLAAAKAKLEQAGALLILEHAEMDGLPTLFARDPDGNLLGFQVTDVNHPYSAAKFKDNGI